MTNIDYDRAYKVLAERQAIYASLFGYPNECPYCHKTIIPEFLYDYIDKENVDIVDIYATLLCPNSNCNTPFIAKSEGRSSAVYEYEKIIKNDSKKRNFQ